MSTSSPDWAKIREYLEPKRSEYWIEEPSLTQKVFLKSMQKEVLFGGAAGGGKLIQDSEYVCTPTGFKQARDVSVGDPVLGRDGETYHVLAISKQQFVPGWRFTFDDGSTAVTNDEHLWLTYNARELEALTKRSDEYRAKRRETRPSRATYGRSEAHSTSVIERNKADGHKRRMEPPTGTVRTTQEIVDTLTVRDGRANHAIPVADPIQLPDRDLKLDPYLLGCWLGDGSTNAGAITGMDPEIHDAFASCGKYVARDPIAKPNNKAWTVTYSGLTKDLRALGVYGRKHIPHDYLWASEGQRLALLQGLMDTDGNVSKSSVEFVNTNQNLVEGVAHLARSLGMKVNVREGRAKLNGQDYGPKWMVKFAANRIVFRLPRKAQAQKIATRRTTKFRYIKEAERVPAQPMRCFKVSSPDELFLVTENFIPTHNSSALIMAALQFVDVPNYSAILFRRTYADLALPGALMDRFRDWTMQYDDVHWNANSYTATFPSGARVTFGYLNNVNDYLRYKGSEFQFIGMDEVTEIRESDYRYMFSRLRGPASGPLSQVPVRMRAATNPAPNWVRQRFLVEGKEKGRIFIPSFLTDNPGIDAEKYRSVLQELDPVERRRLEFGDWWSTALGTLFDRENFEVIDHNEIPSFSSDTQIIRFWDLAGTEPTQSNPDPDWTVGCLGAFDKGVFYIMDVRRIRAKGDKVEKFIRATASEDGPEIPIMMEQEPGSAGKNLIVQYSRYVLPGYNFTGQRATGDKVTRAKPLSAAVANGNVRLIRADWNTDFLDEISSFPEARVHDDQVDAAVHAFNHCAGLGMGLRRRIEIIV